MDADCRRRTGAIGLPSLGTNSRIGAGARTFGRAATLAALGITVLTLAACGTTGTEPVAGPPVDPAGVYDLATVNGEAVPLVTSAETADYTEIEGATLTIDSTGAYRDEFQTLLVQGHSLTIRTKVSVGQWLVEANKVTLVGHSTGDRFATSPSGATLAAVVGELTLLYRRR